MRTVFPVVWLVAWSVLLVGTMFYDFSHGFPFASWEIAHHIPGFLTGLVWGLISTGPMWYQILKAK